MTAVYVQMTNCRDINKNVGSPRQGIDGKWEEWNKHQIQHDKLW